MCSTFERVDSLPLKTQRQLQKLPFLCLLSVGLRHECCVDLDCRCGAGLVFTGLVALAFAR